MKVLLKASVDLSLPGGLETHVLELARALMARGHEVAILGRPDALPPFRMVDRLDPSGYDIVHHHGGTWPLGVRLGPRVVRTFHFSVAAKMRAYLAIGRYRTLLRPGNWQVLLDERRTARGAAALIAVSEQLAGDLAAHHGVPRERIAVIPNGACFDPPRESRAALRVRHGIAPGRPVLVTVGRDDFVKGWALLRRALAGARTRDVLWVQVGGAARAEAPGVLVTGPLARQQVVDWMHAADLAAFPSHYEGGGIALLDALAAGVYSLTHRVGNAAEVVRPGINGEFVEPAVEAWRAALERLLASPPPRHDGALPGRYRWESIAAAVEEVYRRRVSNAR